MPARLLDIREIDDLRDMVQEAAQSLTEGKLVVFPTETVYGIAARALDVDAVRRLVEVKGRQEGHPLPVAIRSSAEAIDFSPEMSDLGVRLARRCWPGPVTLVVDATHTRSLAKQLPEEVLRLVSQKGMIGLRVPAHNLILDTLKTIVGPLVLTSANLSGQPDARTAEEAKQSLGENVDIIFNGGKVRYGDPSTVVRVDGPQIEILREGAIPESTIKRLCAKMFLFVCTGNTCRSPMAEVICEKLLAERLGCELDKLEEQGYLAMSAGLAAGIGAPASEHSATVAGTKGLSLADHQSQPVNESMIRYADRIYTMTRMHRRMILSEWPDAEDRVFTLSTDGSDISDPIGGSIEMYEECAAQIEQELLKRLDNGEFLP